MYVIIQPMHKYGHYHQKQLVSNSFNTEDPRKQVSYKPCAKDPNMFHMFEQDSKNIVDNLGISTPARIE